MQWGASSSAQGLSCFCQGRMRVCVFCVSSSSLFKLTCAVIVPCYPFVHFLQSKYKVQAIMISKYILDMCKTVNSKAWGLRIGPTRSWQAKRLGTWSVSFAVHDLQFLWSSAVQQVQSWKISSIFRWWVCRHERSRKKRDCICWRVGACMTGFAGFTEASWIRRGIQHFGFSSFSCKATGHLWTYRAPQLEISSTSYVGDSNLEEQPSEQGHSLEQLSEQQQGYKLPWMPSDVKMQLRLIL